MSETKPTADRITGQARENVVDAMGEVGVLIAAVTEASLLLHGAMSSYGRGLLLPLPEAAKKIEEAVVDAEKAFNMLREALK